MTFQEYLASNDLDPATMTEKQKKVALTAWKAEYGQPAPAPTPAPEPKKESSFDDTMRAINAESERISKIRELTKEHATKNLGNTDAIKNVEKACEAACADSKTTINDFKLALYQIDHTLPQFTVTPQTQQVNEDVLEAAICQAAGLPNIEKKFTDQTLQAAHSRFRHGLGLQELLCIGAERNSNYRGSNRDLMAVWKAALRPAQSDYYSPNYMQGAGLSTLTVPGILSNVANKFLESGFMYSERAWAEICRRKNAKDFKAISSYRLTAGLKFKKVPPSGEIKEGTLGELSYSNQVETYGIGVGISRPQLVNDDLGAFSEVIPQLGRGAGDSLNDVIWTEWLDDSAFFTSGNANYDDGATDSVLTIAGLTNADNIFASQTKADGSPLGIRPAILLVPRALLATGRVLMNSTTANLVSSTTAITGDINPFSSMFRLVDSVYLQATSIGGATVSGSSTAWYLLADPNDVAAIEIAFLNGVDSPSIETFEFEPNRLGMYSRAYLDFGCNKQEYRAGVKLKGAA